MRVVVLVVLLAACGDDLAGVSIDNYDEAYLAARCRYLVQCGYLRDIETCDRVNIGYLPVSDVLIEAVHKGTVNWHPLAAAECLAKLETASCDREDPARRYACRPDWEPTLRDDQVNVGA